MLFAVSASAQEQATREIKIYEANTVGIGKPIDVIKEVSEVSLRYDFDYPWVYFAGDHLTRLAFAGYNPGKEMERHLTVQVSTDMNGKNFTTVFDGNCTIPQGGTADACIPLVTIDIADPLLVEFISPLTVKVKCTGEAAETPVYFEMYEMESSRLPTLQLSIQSDVSYYESTIADQDGNPVVGATVTLHNSLMTFDATSGDEGRFSVRVDDNNASYCMTVKAPGFAEYETLDFYLKEVPHPSYISIPAPNDIVIYNRLDFTAEHPATLVLPETPNPAWGRYYRLDRHEGRDIIFEREFEPKADIPYVIFPSEDFSINLADYDLAQSKEPESVPFPDTKEFGHTGFQGSYKSQPTRLDLNDGEFIYFLDTTPDCTNGTFLDGRIGACRAYLVLGAYSPEMRYEGPRYVYVGETDGITERQAPTTGNAWCHDLQGRELQGRPEHGVYIQGGRKYVVK